MAIYCLSVILGVRAAVSAKFASATPDIYCICNRIRTTVS